MPKTVVDASVIIDCFQRDSVEREFSLRFIEHMLQRQRMMTMPAHGWFEVWCTLNRLSEIDRTYLPPVFDGRHQLPIELIHIDKDFITKYGNIRIPYIKGSDHIYLVIAYENGYRLVTRDSKMRKIAEDIGIDVSTPAEYVARES